MCGRFTLHLADLAELVSALGVRKLLVTDWQPRYNIAPTQLAPVVLRRERSDDRSLELLRFGFSPAFTRGGARPGKPTMLVNAKVETVAKLGIFRNAFARRRCVVPATGFYEWQPQPGKRAKQPMWIHPEHGELMALAAIYEPSVDQHGEVIDTFAIVTTEPTAQLASIHDRMPLILGPDGVERWLTPGAMPEDVLRGLAAGVKDIELAVRPVSEAVSSPKNDEPRCIEAVSAEPEKDDGGQLDLF